MSLAEHSVELSMDDTLGLSAEHVSELVLDREIEIKAWFMLPRLWDAVKRYSDYIGNAGLTDDQEETFLNEYMAEVKDIIRELPSLTQ